MWPSQADMNLSVGGTSAAVIRWPRPPSGRIWGKSGEETAATINKKNIGLMKDLQEQESDAHCNLYSSYGG